MSRVIERRQIMQALVDYRSGKVSYVGAFQIIDRVLAEYEQRQVRDEVAPESSTPDEWLGPCVSADGQYMW